MADVSSLAGWARKWRRPLDNGRWIWHTAARAQQITSTFASDSGVGYENELEIALRNAGEWFYYDPYYRLLVCGYHGYAVRNSATHLRLQHKVHSSERSAIEQKFRGCKLLDPAQVATQPPLQAPLDWLGAPMRGSMRRTRM